MYLVLPFAVAFVISLGIGYTCICVLRYVCLTVGVYSVFVRYFVMSFFTSFVISLYMHCVRYLFR